MSKLDRLIDKAQEKWSRLLPEGDARAQAQSEIADMIARAQAKGAKDKELREFLGINQYDLEYILRYYHYGLDERTGQDVTFPMALLNLEVHCG